MRRSSACRAIALVSVAWTFTAVSAHADSASDAKDLFSRGRELRLKGDCAAADVLFRKALTLYPAGLGSLRNLAECEEKLSHFASARRAWIDLKRALLTDTAPKYDGWSLDAEQAAARLASKVATLRLDLHVVDPAGDPVAPSGVHVTLDGEPLSLSLLGTPLERDPGRHSLQATGVSVVAPQQSTIELRAGEARQVALRVVVAPPVAPTAAVEAALEPRSSSPDAADDARAVRRTIGWTAIGVGGALIVAAGVSFVVRQNALDDVNAACSTHTGCDPSLESAANRGQVATVLFDAMGAAGVAAVGAGIAFVLGNPSTPSAPGPAVGVRSGGATVTWRF